MIVVDLDGTVLNENKKISDNTKNYLKKLKDKGYIIVIATGRIYASALNVTDYANFSNYIISDTGACIYNRLNSKAIFSKFIDLEIASKIFEYYDKNCRFIDFCNKDFIYKYSDEIEINKVIKNVKNKDYIMNNCKEISHISIVMKNNDDVMNVYKKLVNRFKNIEIIIMQDSYSDRKWIEMMAKDCSKYNGIKKLSNYLGIKNEDIIAFGDGLNDVEMLKKCGHGVALKNALPEVKEVSNDITSYDCNNDGVINYLKEYLKEL